MRGESSWSIQKSEREYCLKIPKGGSKKDRRRIVLCKGRGEEAAWLKQKDAESAGNFGKKSLPRIDNSEFYGTLEIIDDNQDSLV